MKLVAKKYRQLKPTIDHLTDEVIIAQAWKKTHAYIRSHNWYADTLALDVSALGLEANVKIWANGITSEKATPRALELVPAAKSDKWVVDNSKGWVPRATLDQNTLNEWRSAPPLRPLAHLSIRDQTWATAVMLCVADAVETAQGDCSERDYFKAQQNLTYSYGNRLLCDWREGRAWFRWGNGETYRRFFTDYQSFLDRPVKVGRHIAGSSIDEDLVYVVSLDISKFYDDIDRDQLLSRLRAHCSFYEGLDGNEDFWSCVQKIIAWKWSESSRASAKSLRLQLKDGLPQGLVAAGFFANAYMVDFDRSVGGQIGRTILPTQGVVLHDYCRYVDDLRLVISTEVPIDNNLLLEHINSWVGKRLRDFGGEALKLNQRKTQITSLSNLDNRGSLSKRVASLQEEISGPSDRDSLDSAMGVLEGFLALQTEALPEQVDTPADNALVQLARFDHDIRPDTLKRFAANRLESLMRSKRKIDFSGKEDSLSKNLPLDNESELLSKKLILAWMQDPSLALVLRKALEVFPSPMIAEPVFEAIYGRSTAGDSKTDDVTRAVANYLLADMFRSCVDFHGQYQRIEYPESADPEGLLSLAVRYAQKLLSSASVPRFVERQALLFLAVMQKPVSLNDDEPTIHHTLHAILAGAPVDLKRQKLALYEVAAQILGSPDMVASLLIDHMAKASGKLRRSILDEFAKRGGPFWESLWRRLSKSGHHKQFAKDYRWASPIGGGDPHPVGQRLSNLIASNHNGFVHEAALVKLGLALLEALEDEAVDVGMSPNHIVVKQTQKPRREWASIWKSEVTLQCRSRVATGDPRYSTPSWIDPEVPDAAKIYWIGTILRSAAIAAIDFTSNRWKIGKVSGYKGLRTGWYKRRMGMMHAPESLVGEIATLSDWAAELLMKCLQWPGFEASYLQHDDIAAVSDLDDLRSALGNRLRVLDQLVCEASGMPGLVTRVSRPDDKSIPGFRIVTVQQLLPRTNDFSQSDPCLNSARIKQSNRDHVARLCQITYKTLNAKLYADGFETKTRADLIVFPEVGVHIDDQDLLKRLSDKTQAIVLAGLVFIDKGGELVNLARWFIPDYRESGRQWVIRDQGKRFPTRVEKDLGIQPYRPCQHIIEIVGMEGGPFMLTGSICYDATDLKLASDMKGKSDLFVVVAHNRDVKTFDSMASALHYHMYQHVVVVNKGEFGGSTIQAPYKEHFDRLISHAHGGDQISINVADLDLAAFKRGPQRTSKEIKTRPAGD